MSITVEELQSRKRDLERRLLSCIEVEVNRFRQDTGYTPTYVNVNMCKLTPVGGRKERVLTGVSIGVDLD